MVWPTTLPKTCLIVTSMRGSDENAGLGMYRIYNVVHQVLKGKIKVLDGPGFKIQIRFHLPQNE